MIAFIDWYKDRFLVEFMCAPLNTHREGGSMTSRGYRQSTSCGVSARAVRDVVVIERIKQIRRDNYSVYGIRKM